MASNRGAGDAAIGMASWTDGFDGRVVDERRECSMAIPYSRRPRSSTPMGHQLGVLTVSPRSPTWAEGTKPSLKAVAALGTDRAQAPQPMQSSASLTAITSGPHHPDPRRRTHRRADPLLDQLEHPARGPCSNGHSRCRCAGSTARMNFGCRLAAAGQPCDGLSTSRSPLSVLE